LQDCQGGLQSSWSLENGKATSRGASWGQTGCERSTAQVKTHSSWCPKDNSQIKLWGAQWGSRWGSVSSEGLDFTPSLGPSVLLAGTALGVRSHTQHPSAHLVTLTCMRPCLSQILISPHYLPRWHLEVILAVPKSYPRVIKCCKVGTLF
jgi:hypothetical protein